MSSHAGFDSFNKYMDLLKGEDVITMNCFDVFSSWLNTNSGIPTFLTAIATFITCWCSYRSSKATRAQVNEMKRQFNEANRPNIEVEFLYIKRAFYGLRFINQGKCTAQQVEICLDSAFINSITEKSFSDRLKRQNGKSCLIGVGQHYDLFFGSNDYRNNPHKVPAKGLVRYKANGNSYESEFYIDLENYATIYSVNSEQEDLIKELKEQTSELKELKQELSNIGRYLQKSSEE